MIVYRTVQITPATSGWWAVYRGDGDKRERAPVAFWALMEDPQGEREVHGVDPTCEGWYGETCQEVGNFIGYVYDTGYAYRPPEPDGAST